MSKRRRGAYYTVGNPFDNPAFTRWATGVNLPEGCILEPYAGANSLIDRLVEMGWCRHSASFDIQPTAKGVKRRDTLVSFPRGYDICVTNPPWLAKNSATARGLSFPDTRHDDLYKIALERCLGHCGWVAALVPESFIRTSLFRDRLTDFVSLTTRMFAETNHPVGLALFEPEESEDVLVWRDGEKVGSLSSLERARPRPGHDGVEVTFNDPDGNVGLIALDNTIERSIRFCDVGELENYQVKPSGRHITKLKVNGRIRIKEWNDILNDFRNKTQDVLLTCYKGIRKDGWYRRRLDWETARGIVNRAA